MSGNFGCLTNLKMFLRILFGQKQKYIMNMKTRAAVVYELNQGGSILNEE